MIPLGVTDSGCPAGGSGGAAVPGAAVPPAQSQPCSVPSGLVPQARGAEGQGDPTDLHLPLRAAPALLLRARLRAAGLSPEPVPG